MAASTETTEFSVKEAVAYALLRDNADGIPTYAKGVKVPGIVGATLTENMTIVPIPGDDTILDTQSSLESVEANIEYNKKSHKLDSLIKGAVHRLLSDESQSILGGSDQPSKYALVLRCTKVSAGSNAACMLHIYNMSAGTRSGAYANKEAKSNSFDAQLSQISGKILHPKGNDFYCDRIVNADTPINYDHPFPPLPAATTTPTISSISVAEGDTDVAVDEAFNIVFSAEIDDDFINNNYFYIKDNDTGAAVPAAVSKSTVTVTVTPSSNLTNSDSYTLIVDKNVSDATNNIPTDDPRAVSFTVVDA